MNLIKLLLILLTVGNLYAQTNQLCFRMKWGAIFPFAKLKSGSSVEKYEFYQGIPLTNLQGITLLVKSKDCKFSVYFQVKNNDYDRDYEVDQCGPCRKNADYNFGGMKVFLGQFQGDTHNAGNGKYYLFSSKGAGLQNVQPFDVFPGDFSDDDKAGTNRFGNH